MTKGLVCSALCALVTLLAPACLALENELQLTSLLDEAEVAASGDCAAECCGECISCSDPAGRTPFWFAGTEATFMQVDATSGGQITLSFNDTDTAGTDISFLDGNGLESFTFAPRVWFGRQFGEKWAVATRYWELNDNEQNAPALTPGTTPLTTFGTYTETDRARFYAFDVEGIRSFRPGKWKIDGTMGARHASIGVNSEIHAFGVITSGNFVNLFLSNGFSFDGTGVTGALSARRPIGDSPVTFFSSVRGSYMGGRTDSFGRAAGAVAAAPNPPLVGAATVTRNNAMSELDILEYQVGLQWDFRLRALPVNAFFRTAFEYQFWDIDGPPTGGAGFGGTLADLTTNSFASAGIGGAHLYGLAIGTGFTW